MSENIEIERKFLVAEPPALDGLEAQVIRQGYVTGTEDAVEVRLRQKGPRHFLTVKCGGAVARSEYEVAIDGAQFDVLWPASAGQRVEKTRYHGDLGEGLTFELDVYAGHLAPLVVVEVEFPSIAAAEGFEPPGWFGVDVSADKRYKNKRLAVADGPP